MTLSARWLPCGRCGAGRIRSGVEVIWTDDGWRCRPCAAEDELEPRNDELPPREDDDE